MVRGNIDFRNPAIVRRAGMDALMKELGTVGAAYYLRQYSAGRGDYATERDKFLQGITLDEIIQNVRKLDAQKA